MVVSLSMFKSISLKNLLFILLFVPIVVFGQNNNVVIKSGDDTYQTAMKLGAEAIKEQGITYLGKGKYSIAQMGGSGFIGLKKLNMN